MKKNIVSRREFLKTSGFAGLAGLALAGSGSVGCSKDRRDVMSSDDTGGFYIRRHPEGERPYTVNDEMYTRPDFHEIGLEFMANLDGERRFQERRRKHLENKDPGSTRLDYAFNAGSWAVASGMPGNMTGGDGLLSWNTLDGEVKAWGFEGERWDPADDGITPEHLSAIVKKAAKFYGASLSGIAEVDERWVYTAQPFFGHGRPEPIIGGLDLSMVPPGIKPEMVKTMVPKAPIVFRDVEAPVVEKKGTRIIPKSIKYAVVVAMEMDYEAMESEPSAIAEVGTSNGYSRMTFVAACLAQFLRGLGYHAIPIGNDTALSVPMAIDAGLGELGRNGVVITPKYGPRVRLAKVLTDLPLFPDRPISFGVTEFCDICGKCADFCPSEALPHGPRTYEAVGLGPSGVLKWPIDNKKCFKTWCDFGHSCHNCIRVCPFNKPDSWLHDITKNLIGVQSASVDKMLLKLDDASGYGKGKDPRQFWDKDTYIHTKG